MSINKVILVGNVGKDPEVHYIESGLAVAKFPLATSEKAYTTRDGRQVPERTEWHNIVVWRKLAEVVEKHVKKGTQLYLEGKIRSRSYEDKDGVKRYVTEIVVDVLQLLGTRPPGTATEENKTSSENTTVNPDAKKETTGSAGTTSSVNEQDSQKTDDANSGNTGNEDNDDLPF